MAAIWAASVGDTSPGRNATRNFSRSVWLISAAVTSHASSHQVPVGVSTASNPSCSADLAIWPRYSRLGGRSADAAPVTREPLVSAAVGWALVELPSGRLWPRPMIARPSPEVGRNQWNRRLMTIRPRRY